MTKVRMILKLAQLFFAAGSIVPRKGDLILLTTGAKVVYKGSGWYELTHSYSYHDTADFECAGHYGWDQWHQILASRKRQEQCRRSQNRGLCQPSPGNCNTCRFQF